MFIKLETDIFFSTSRAQMFQLPFRKNKNTHFNVPKSKPDESSDFLCALCWRFLFLRTLRESKRSENSRCRQQKFLPFGNFRWVLFTSRRTNLWFRIIWHWGSEEISKLHCTNISKSSQKKNQPQPDVDVCSACRDFFSFERPFVGANIHWWPETSEDLSFSGNECLKIGCPKNHWTLQ